MTTSRGAVLGEATLACADRGFRADLLHWAARRLPGCTPGAIREAAIVLGELLTNAYHHGEPPFRVSITARRRGHLLRLAVDDAATAPHTPWSPGKGLFVVRGLCRRWGVHPTPAGKTVWADLPVLVPPTRHVTERHVEERPEPPGADDDEPAHSFTREKQPHRPAGPARRGGDASAGTGPAARRRAWP